MTQTTGFEITATAGRARGGRLTTPHGVIETPAFMPVGTLGSVKGLGPEDLEAAGASVMLANLYHLALRPGIDVISGLGGVHAFTGWRRPILTDSGGFQVFSLAGLRKVDEGGVTFRSHLDGATLRFTPESVVRMQAAIGVDVAMVLDECPPWPVAPREAEASWRRTLAWAVRAREEAEEVRAAAGAGGPSGDGGSAAAGSSSNAGSNAGSSGNAIGALFGIVQGSTDRHLRQRAAEEIAGVGFDGHAIGGVSVGEPAPLRRQVVEWTAPLLPADRPRYLMGVGYPDDILHAVAWGVDLFDCVLPARNARHGALFTRDGVIKIKQARYRDDPAPVEEGCPCPACRRVSRAFLHHLVRAGELTGKVLATAHNVRHYLDLMAGVRQAIASGTFSEPAAASPEAAPQSPEDPGGAPRRVPEPRGA